MQSPPGPETVIDGVRYLYFGGTSYLGLAGRPEVIEAGCEALRRHGVHSATTRARFGTIPPVLQVEQRSAEFFGTEDAFYFASGYVANHIMAAALAPAVDAVLVDEASHYSVVEAARLTGKPVHHFRHADPSEVARSSADYPRVLVMADGVNPSTGETAPMEAFAAALRHKKEASLLLDDAHGLGVLGAQGRGVLDEAGLWQHVNGGPPWNGVRLYVCGTLSKALGGFGGIIPGTRAFVDHVRQASHYFDGASAPSAADAGASAQALEIVIREPELRRQLQANIHRVRSGVRALGWSVPAGNSANFGITHEQPARLIHLHETLRARGILLPYVGAYSGLPPAGVLRFAIFATHSSHQLDRLLGELGKSP